MTAPVPLPQDDLHRQLKKHFLGALLSLVVIAVIAALLLVRYRAELDAFTIAVFDAVGIGGLIAILFFTDCCVSPFPPDSILILIAASPYHQYWPWLLPLIGFISALAGCLGYSAGRFLSKKSWAQKWIGSFHGKSQHLVRRFGPWGVAIGALTPVPFSITCWAAGLFRLEFKSFVGPALLRIPRYVLYYAAIAYFPRLFS